MKIILSLVLLSFGVAQYERVRDGQLFIAGRFRMRETIFESAVASVALPDAKRRE
jgi:hypothetical protein